MHILITTGIYPPEIGGPATYIAELIKHHFKENCHFEIITYSRSGNFLQRQFCLFREIFIYRDLTDIVYAQDPLIVGLVSGFAGKILRKKGVVRYGGDPAWEAAFGQGKTKKTLVEFIQHPDGGIKAKFDIFLTKLSFTLVDKIITNSEFLKIVVQNAYGVNSKKIIVINNAIEAESFPDKKQIDKKIYSVLSFGRLARWKKYDEIIDAVDRINDKGRIKIKLTIFGEGPERDNLKKINKDFLELLPSKSHDESLKFLHLVDVYILNSLYEGSPNQVIEAFSVGTPVVATDVPGTDEIAINNKTALTVKPGDINSLSLAIEKVLTDKPLAKKLVAGGKKMLEKFTWEKHLAQLYNVFNDCLSPHSRTY